MNPIPVLLLAGCRPGSDPICETYGTNYKTIAPVAGVPMILHALRNLTECDFVSEIIVLAQEPEKIREKLDQYSPGNKVSFHPGCDSISATILRAWDKLGGVTPLLITTADNCLLRQRHLDEFLSKALSHKSDIAMGFVSRNQLQASYPESGRTWIRFNDAELTGCNLFLLKNKGARLTVEFWEDFEARPKKILRMAWKLGPTLFCHYLKCDLNIKTGFEEVSRLAKSSVRPVILTDPAIAIDADKLSDIRQIETIMAYTGNVKPKNSVQNQPVVIFDLDRTITSFGTYTPFLVYYALGQQPQKLLLLPLIAAYMITYKLGGLSRSQLKNRMFDLLVGQPDVTTLNRVCNAFVDRTFKKGVYQDALDTVRHWRNREATLVLATASYDWMANIFASHLGFTRVVATRSVKQDNRVVAGIDGENCYGQDKCRMVMEAIGPLQGKPVWFYTDDHSDIPLLQQCSHPVAINPTRKLKNWVARTANASFLEWQNQPATGDPRRKPAVNFGIPLLRTSALFASIFVITTLSSSDILWANDEIPLNRVPNPVMQAALTSLPGITILNAETDHINGEMIYELEGVEGDSNYEIEVTPDGVILEIEKTGFYEKEERIALYKVPEAVLQATYTTLPGITLFEAEIEYANNTPIFEMEGVINGIKYEIEVRVDGSVIAVEEEPTYNHIDQRISKIYNNFRELFL